MSSIAKFLLSLFKVKRKNSVKVVETEEQEATNADKIAKHAQQVAKNADKIAKHA